MTGGSKSGKRPVTMDVPSAEFDEMLARMQTDEARAGMRAAFVASANELGRAALEAARRASRDGDHP